MNKSNGMSSLHQQTDPRATLACFGAVSDADLDSVTGGGVSQRIPVKTTDGAHGHGGEAPTFGKDAKTELAIGLLLSFLG